MFPTHLSIMWRCSLLSSSQAQAVNRAEGEVETRAVTVVTELATTPVVSGAVEWRTSTSVTAIATIVWRDVGSSPCCQAMWVRRVRARWEGGEEGGRASQARGRVRSAGWGRQADQGSSWKRRPHLRPTLDTLSPSSLGRVRAHQEAILCYNPGNKLNLSKRQVMDYYLRIVPSMTGCLEQRPVSRSLQFLLLESRVPSHTNPTLKMSMAARSMNLVDL